MATEPEVEWMGDSRRGLTDEERKAVESDLKYTYAPGCDGDCGGFAPVDSPDSSVDHPRPVKVFVKQRFSGYSDEPLKKIIVALEIHRGDDIECCIAKIGKLKEVQKDVLGWDSCTKGHGVSSRMFIKPELTWASSSRGVVIYPDAYQFYFDRETDKPCELESAFKYSIENRNPTNTSLERVITQVYTEAHRCFYHFANVVINQQLVQDQLSDALRDGRPDSVVGKWNSDDFILLRRNAAWLTCGKRKPELLSRPDYIDPIDYLNWAMAAEAIPPMTLGPSHGDLHGRNIIVGIVRGEAEWPAVFDYDKMSARNLVALDFAKLEIELKCRLLQPFLDSVEKRSEARSLLGLGKELPLPSSITSQEDHETTRQASRMEVMFAIENHLQNWSAQMTSRERAITKDAEVVNWVSESTDLGKALGTIFRIRREAAVYLGFERQGRPGSWLDELNFALTVYGAMAIKWHEVNDFMQWSLLTAGVAASRLTQFPWPPDLESTPDPEAVPSYFHLLPWADKQWRDGDPKKAIEVLENGISKFPYATALRQQLALILAASDNGDADERARREVSELADLARVFRDHETLCRLGRVFKDKGDNAYETAEMKLTLQQILAEKLAVYQHYLASLDYYESAFQVSDDYYPAINVATLALLTGDHAKKKEVAQRVLDLCGAMSTNREDRTWILASEGEASLLLGKREIAANFYKNAINSVLQTEKGTVQPMYDQLCRLHWALGNESVAPVIEVFEQSGWLAKLDAGPFGNCGR